MIESNAVREKKQENFTRKNVMFFFFIVPEKSIERRGKMKRTMRNKKNDGNIFECLDWTNWRNYRSD